MLQWNQFGLQDALSPVIEEFIFFHDYIIIILIYIISVVGYMLARLVRIPWLNRGLIEGQAIECAWTVAPAIVLIAIAVPSLILLYRLDERRRCALTLKAVGHQWYWSYELTDFWLLQSQKAIEFDAYIIPNEETTAGLFRLLDTDNRPALPYLTQIRVLVRRADVLHSWAVPSLGVKIDANPGRLNQTKFLSYRPGLAYGQCSEICGANHRFIPISLEFVRIRDFLKWVSLFED